MNLITGFTDPHFIVVKPNMALRTELVTSMVTKYFTAKFLMINFISMSN